MLFCPECLNYLDFMRTINTDIDDKIILKKPIDLFKVIDTNENIQLYKLGFLKKDLLDNKKYLKYPDEIKNNIKNMSYEKINNIVSIEYKCHNCNYIKPINETILLYSENNNNELIKVNTIEENKLIFMNPILPHTHDYTCKNIECITHTNNILKDAVFYKSRNSYKVNYICGNCFFSW